jgi:hypothetical protein
MRWDHRTPAALDEVAQKARLTGGSAGGYDADSACRRGVREPVRRQPCGTNYSRRSWSSWPVRVRIALSFGLWYGDYGGTAHVDFRLRPVGRRATTTPAEYIDTMSGLNRLRSEDEFQALLRARRAILFFWVPWAAQAFRAEAIVETWAREQPPRPGKPG